MALPSNPMISTLPPGLRVCLNRDLPLWPAFPSLALRPRGSAPWPQSSCGEATVTPWASKAGHSSCPGLPPHAPGGTEALAAGWTAQPHAKEDPRRLFYTSTSPLPASLTPHPPTPDPCAWPRLCLEPALCQFPLLRHPVPLAPHLPPSCSFRTLSWLPLLSPVSPLDLPHRDQLADANNGTPGYWSGG